MKSNCANVLSNAAFLKPSLLHRHFFLFGLVREKQAERYEKKLPLKFVLAHICGVAESAFSLALPVDPIDQKLGENATRRQV